MKKSQWFAGLLVMAWLVTVLPLGGCMGGQAVSVGTKPIVVPENQELPTPLPGQPASNVILMDGELIAAYPTLKLGFSGNQSAKLLALHVGVGQRVQAGELIAVLDDGDLHKSVEDAKIALDRAREDKAQAEADLENKYQDALENAKEKYDQETESAEKKYERELEDAQNALENAEYNLRRAKMQPPTTSIVEAEASLRRALDIEADAADNYKQSLDRPWEPQSIRDSLYEEWQMRIEDRELAELRLRDARLTLQVYHMDLEQKQVEVDRAKDHLAQVERDEVEMDEAKKETNLTSYERAIADAEKRLGEAQADLILAELYAPWDALVLSVDANVGSTIGSGTPVVTLLYTQGVYFVTDNLSERHVAQLRKGQHADITLRTYPDVVLAARVDTILPETERQANAEARFTAYIVLDETDLDLLPGMTGRVEVITGKE